MERYKNMKLRKLANVKMIRNLIFFIGLIVLTFWLLFKDQDLNELINVINKADKTYIFIALFLMLCVYLMESINIRSILISLGEKKFSILRAFKYTAIGSFFSAITPAATGGQPVEIYYMSKDGIKTSNGTLTMLIQLCGFQISTITLSLICACINPNLLSGGIFWFYLLGIGINSIALAFMLIATFSEKITKIFLKLTLKSMKKANIKNYNLRKQKLEDGLNRYIESSKYIKKHKKEFIKAILRVFVQITIYHAIPYFIYRSFGLNDLSFFDMFVMQAILYTTVSGIPLPGSIGVSETLFLKLYGTAFGTKLLSGAMLLYRFVSFYLYIILFSVVVIINAVKSKNIESEIDKDVKEVEKDYKQVNKLAYTN